MKTPGCVYCRERRKLNCAFLINKQYGRIQMSDTLRKNTARRFREKLEGVKNGKQQDPH
jgi:hypothetical protein